jgi:ribosomal protein L16 Arg81 hydroxylase
MSSPWLEELAPAVFLSEIYLRKPYSAAQVATPYVPLLTWQILWRVLPRCDAADVLVVRDARLSRGPEPRTREEGEQLFAAGHSLVLRHAERHDAGLAALARGVAAALGGPVAVQLYATPGGHSSFGWHYDAEEVFIVQTAGAKRYLLRENTVRPHPLLGAMPVDQQFEKETSPTLRCDLVPGDWLYVPSGMWHVAKAETDSLSISIGVAALTAMDLYDELRARFAESPSWRRRLPPRGATADVIPALREEAARIFGNAEELEAALERLRERRARELAQPEDVDLAGRPRPVAGP